MLLGYSFEPRPNSCAVGTDNLVMTISLSINKMLALGKKKKDSLRVENKID